MTIQLSRVWSIARVTYLADFLLYNISRESDQVAILIKVRLAVIAYSCLLTSTPRRVINLYSQSPPAMLSEKNISRSLHNGRELRQKSRERSDASRANIYGCHLNFNKTPGLGARVFASNRRDFTCDIVSAS